MKFTRPDIFRIYLIGDEHGGTIHHTDHELAKTIKLVKDNPNAYWVGMGDKCEFITPSDPRWDGGGVADWVSPDNIGVDESNWYCDIMTPIKDKCIGLLCGNHEDSIKKHSHIDVHANICKGMGVDDLSSACFVKFTFARSGSRCEYIGFFTHGAGSPIMPGTKLQRLSRLMDGFDADMVAQGHLHDLLNYTKPYLKIDKEGRVKQRVKVGAITGCYFRTYTQDAPSSYGEKKNYPPTMIGSPVFIIEPDKLILKVENG